VPLIRNGRAGTIHAPPAALVVAVVAGTTQHVPATSVPPRVAATVRLLAASPGGERIDTGLNPEWFKYGPLLLGAADEPVEVGVR